MCAFLVKGKWCLEISVTIEPGVVLRAEEGALIEIGAGSYIGAHSFLAVRRGQVIRFGQSSGLGSWCHVISERGIFLGDGSSLGSKSFVGPREDAAQGSLVVGTKSHLHNHTWIDLCADVAVGNDVRTGPYCAFYTHNHLPMPGKLIWDQIPSFDAISVGVGDLDRTRLLRSVQGFRSAIIVRSQRARSSPSPSKRGLSSEVFQHGYLRLYFHKASRCTI